MYIVTGTDDRYHSQCRILGLIKRPFTSRASTVIKRLYTSMVRPILEYGNAPRIQQYHGDIEKLERVQRRVTRLCAEIKDLPYEGRLRSLKSVIPAVSEREGEREMGA